MTKILTILTLAGGIACGATDAPSHIVQPLPRELDPMLEPALQVPAAIARPLTERETVQRDKDLAPVPSAPLEEDGQKAMAAQDAQDTEVDEQIRGFRQQYNVSINATPSPAPSVPADTVREDASKEPPTEIKCDEGVYFDAKEGLLVYMKNVHVRNPNFSLDCTGPLKIYLDHVEKEGNKKPSERAQDEGTKADEANPALPGGGNFNFNSLKKVAASGSVVAHYTDGEGKTYKATAEKITYDAKTGEIILTGNYPAISYRDGSGTSTSRSRAKNGFIRIYPSGDMYFSHGADTTFHGLDKQLSDRKKQKNSSKP